MDLRSLRRRDFLKLSSFVVGSSVLAACAPKVVEVEKIVKETVVVEKEVEKVVKEAVEVEKEVTRVVEKVVQASAEEYELIYWMAWGSDAADATMAMQEMPEFQDTLPGAKLTVTPSMNMESLLTAIASGSGPDGASNLPYPELYARDALIPVTDWIAASGSIHPSDFLEANWTGAQYQNETWGVPCMECFVRYGLGIDQIRWEEAGFDSASLPVTWDEVYDAHVKLTTFDDAGNLDVMGLDPYERMGGSIGYGNPWMIPHSWGFDYYDPAAATFNIDNEKMVDAWKMLSKFYEVMGPEKVTGFRESFGNWGQGWRQGKTVMCIDGYWGPPGAEKNNPERPKLYTWLPVPEARRGTRIQVAGGHYIVIPKIAKQPEAMYKFSELVATNDVLCNHIYDRLGWLPARKSYISGKDVSNYPGLDWYIESALDNDVLGAIVVNPITGITASAWYRLREEVYFGDKSVEEAVAQMQKECDEELQSMLEG